MRLTKAFSLVGEAFLNPENKRLKDSFRKLSTHAGNLFLLVEY